MGRETEREREADGQGDRQREVVQQTSQVGKADGKKSEAKTESEAPVTSSLLAEGGRAEREGIGNEREVGKGKEGTGRGIGRKGELVGSAWDCRQGENKRSVNEKGVGKEEGRVCVKGVTGAELRV